MSHTFPLIPSLFKKKLCLLPILSLSSFLFSETPIDPLARPIICVHKFYKEIKTFHKCLAFKRSSATRRRCESRLGSLVLITIFPRASSSMVLQAMKSNTQIKMLSLITLILFMVSLSRIDAWDCESSCGGISLNYPFGSGWNCGSSAFQPYVNCSNGKLHFYTPTGIYTIKSIDYSSKVMIIEDPHMSTCTSMQGSGAFGLPVGAPFAFASYDKVVLIGCSSTSSLYSKQSCDTSTEAQELCESIYGNCAAISEVGIVSASNSNYVKGAASSCCVYASNLLGTAPYEIDLPLLQCTTYISVYHIGSIHSPQSSWLFGIALQYNPSQSSSPYNGGQNPSCYVCQEAEESAGSFGASPWIGGLTVLGATVTFTML